MNQERKQKISKKIMIYAMVISLICVAGISYAFFTAGLSSETSTTVRADAGTMKITYDGGANINLSGIYPRDEVWATKEITVTGNNTTDAEMYYKLTLVVDSNTFKSSDPLQYELVSPNTSTNGEVIPTISKTDITSSTYELGNGHFVKANNAKHKYQLKIYYPKTSSSQNDNQGASFSAHVEIASVKPPKTTGTLSELILYNNEVKASLTIPGNEVSAHTLEDVESLTTSVGSSARNYYITYGTGWVANGDGFDLTGATVTSDTYANSYSDLVGKYLPVTSDYFSFSDFSSNTSGTMKSTINISSLYYVENATANSLTYKQVTSNKNIKEALLASAEDDYGISYYFRGAVKNNYVEFANKCWRIVRITGDGSVKLVLHNDNTDNSSSPCSSTNNSPSAAFARYSGSTYTTTFNDNYDYNKYVGFMYGGTLGSSDYASTHANTNKSTILTNLETWYTNNLISYEDKLADTIWCNDKSTSSGSGYLANSTYYAAYGRLFSDKIPTLKCPNDNNGGKLSKFTVGDMTNGNGSLSYKIGLLTADEIAFAGSVSKYYNSSTYLQENTGTEWWWTLSPYYFSGYYAYIWYVGTGVLSTNRVYYSYGLRPAISLKSSVTVTGVGTSENPYKVI